MTTRKYDGASLRKVTETKKNRRGEDVVVPKYYQGVLTYKEENPDFVERDPTAEKDTRTPRQKRRNLVKQITKVLDVEMPKNYTKAELNRADREAEIALEEWRKEMGSVEEKPESASVYQVVSDYVERRAKLSEAANWDTTQRLPNNEKVIQPSTVRDYHHTMRLIEPTFSSIPVDELTMKTVLDWEEKRLIEGSGLATIRKAHVLLKQALNDAAIRGIVDANMMAPLKAPTLKAKENVALSIEDQKKVTAMLSKLEPTPVAVTGLLALRCGLRGGEICGLTWGAVDFDKRLVNVVQSVGIGDGGKFLKPPKSESGKRSVWMDDYVYKMLLRRRSAMLKERDNITESFDELFVVGSAAGDYLTPSTVSKAWTTLANSWGLEGKNGGKVTLHKLRHSFVDAVRKGNGGSAKTIRDVVGHSSTMMTDKYGTRDQDSENEAVIAASLLTSPSASTVTSADVYDFKPNGTEG